jgi:hypothetical protein
MPLITPAGKGMTLGSGRDARSTQSPSLAVLDCLRFSGHVVPCQRCLSRDRAWSLIDKEVLVSFVSRHFSVPIRSLNRRSFIVICAALLAALSSSLAVAQNDPLHMWAGKLDKPGAEKWVADHLAREQKDIDELLAVKGAHTVANTLRPFDNAQNELNVAGAESYLMFAVATQKEVRDAGQALAQKVQEASTILGLNQDVYHALKAVELSGADAATRHYMDRTLLEYRLSGVDEMTQRGPGSRKCRTTSPSRR